MPQTAIVLAGGLGTRLRESLTGQPKVLAPAKGRPFLDYLLAYLASQGIGQVVLATGYLASQIRAFAGDGGRWGIALAYSEEREPLGTGGALRLASEMLDTEVFFALNGDTLFQVDLHGLWEAHCKFRRTGSAATLALRRVRSSERMARGCVILANDGKILSFSEKPGSPREPATGRIAPDEALPPETVLVNGGVYALEKAALGPVAPGEKASLELDVFPRLARHGQISGIIEAGYFADIGTPESLAAFQRDIGQGIVKFAGAPGSAHRDGPAEKSVQS